MFKKHHRKSANPIFILFRLILSLTMFAMLLGGAYTAYKHFSGLDPLKLDPQAVLKNVISVRNPEQLAAVLSSLKIDQTLLKGNKKVIPGSNEVLGQSAPSQSNPAKYVFRFLLVADSHNDNVNLQKAIAQAKTKYPDLVFVIGLGDYTDVGTIEELNNAKKELDSSGLRYFVIPGDHDLWDSRNRSLNATYDFNQVFGPTFQSFSYEKYRFLLLDNSDDYLGFGEAQSKWISSELERAKTDAVKGILVFLHEPLFHPSSDHVMGKTEKDLKRQAKNLMFELKEAGVKKVFTADIHYFSEYTEPETSLPMVTIGAVVTDRNPQAPRYAVGYVFEDGSNKIEDVEIK